MQFTRNQWDGFRPLECPFAFKRDPFVGEVFRAYGAYENGQLEIVWGRDPPAVLVESVTYFARCLNNAQSWQIEERDRRRREREAASG